MSRSYKHTPRSGQRKNKFIKQYANRKLRREKLKEETPQYGGYRKRTEWWDICDYETVGETFERYYASEIDCWYRWEHQYKPFPDRKELKKEYDKYYIRK